ncbi:GNAT family N-acetyltransferase [Halobacillus amylolyticus]|uniref:GNAT family N-acetyltransferase n=1 Tax=Halobacillus amylolyticus TaxID=2932259 RepID=A0ABY4HD99_9BACI|nr:GNAT family N-acetyltransferase [Halobacillus amylolyticus]UOR12863.1 GNAT family N-acetyltransferase [Halobacillus amylolyticus]
MDEIRVRSVNKSDTTKLLDLMNQYIVDFYKQPQPDNEALINLIHHLIENPTKGLQFVAVKSDELVGFATLYYTFSTLSVGRQAILNDLFVNPEVRGQRLGERLFEKCLDHIRENNFCSMIWETAEDNHIAKSLYNKMGGKKSEFTHYEIY